MGGTLKNIIMKTLLTSLLILISFNFYGQTLQDCEVDITPPTFIFPDPCDQTLFDVDEFCHYANEAAVPSLGEIMDLVEPTILDNCSIWDVEPFDMSMTCNYMGSYLGYHKIACTVEDGAGNISWDWAWFKWGYGF